MYRARNRHRRWHGYRRIGARQANRRASRRGRLGQTHYPSASLTSEIVAGETLIELNAAAALAGGLYSNCMTSKSFAVSARNA